MQPLSTRTLNQFCVHTTCRTIDIGVTSHDLVNSVSIKFLPCESQIL